MCLFTKQKNFKKIMDTRYQPLYRQATALQNRFHGYTQANAFDPGAMMLQKQIHGLTNDLASGKSPRLIDTRLKNIQSQMRRTQIQSPGAMAGQSPLLNNSQKSFMRNNFESMRQNILQHPNF